MHHGRPESDIRLKIGMKRNGEITAVDAECVQRGGAYAGYGLVTILYAGALLHALYRVPAVKYRGYASTPTRRPAARCAATARSRCATPSSRCSTRWRPSSGSIPFAVRRANLHRAAAPDRQRPAGELLRPAANASTGSRRPRGWKARKGRLPRGRGLGMACSHYVSGSAKPVHWSGEPHAAVNLRLDFDGGITLLTGAADIGQGSSTLLAMVVAEVLGIGLERIRVIAADSALTPKDNGSYSSRVSFMVGNAALAAARELKTSCWMPQARPGIDPASFRVGTKRSGLRSLKTARSPTRGTVHRARPSCKAASSAAQRSGRARPSPTPRRWSRSQWTRRPAK